MVLANAFLDGIEVPVTPEWFHINSNAIFILSARAMQRECPQEAESILVQIFISIRSSGACAFASRNSVLRNDKHRIFEELLVSLLDKLKDIND